MRSGYRARLHRLVLYEGEVSGVARIAVCTQRKRWDLASSGIVSKGFGLTLGELGEI